MSFLNNSEISTSIKNAVRHLQQLGESFQANTFNNYDLNNIDSVADTLMALETEIMKLNSDYETESIESSRLRHMLKLLPTTIKNEIQAAVNMARESNASVIQKLQNELDGQLNLVQICTEQTAQLNAAINALQTEKDSVKQQYDSTITEVNQRISEKAALQINLNETRDTVRETNQHTFDLEEDIRSLKQRLMQERNEARQEKVRLEDEISTTSKKQDDQERANQILKRDVDAANLKVSESELQLRTMYRERERFEMENVELKKKLDEQTELYEMERREHDRLLRERLQFTESCGIALLDYQAKKASLEEREATAHQRTNEETENLKTLKLKHDALTKQIEETIEASKTLEITIAEMGKQLEEIKQDIAGKLEKTAKLNLDNADTTKELDSMREAHQMMIDSLKLQAGTLERELNQIRTTRIAKQKERDGLLKSIEQTKITSRNNDIQHNRFVTQTTAKVNELTERKSILDRNAREDQLQINQFSDQLSNLKDEYRKMKIQFEQQIKHLEESTAQLLIAIDINRNKVNETTPGFQRLTEEHEKISNLYEATKETMIEAKRKKQEILDKISHVQREIQDKNKSRDITIIAVKASQHETQLRMQKAHENMLKLEEEIYEKGCRLETLEEENERFQKTMDYLKSQIDLFNCFTQQSSADIKHLNENNHDLIEILETGWKDDRQIENKAAEQDLKSIDNFNALLKHIEKRKTKVGTVVHRLIGELQQLKYYLEGMSTPIEQISSDPADDQQPETSREPSRCQSAATERDHSRESSLIDSAKRHQRPQSATQADVSTPTPLRLTDDVKRRVKIFVHENFDVKSTSTRKITKNNKRNSSTGRQSAQTELSSWKSGVNSRASQYEEIDRKKTESKTKVAFE